MKIIIALTFAAMVTLIYADEDAASQPDRSKRSSMMDRMPLSFGKRIPNRSLRSILDRMSAGYGKRNPDTKSSRGVLTVDDMAALVLTDPHLAKRFVQLYIDTDIGHTVCVECDRGRVKTSSPPGCEWEPGNGVISEDELFPGILQ